MRDSGRFCNTVFGRNGVYFEDGFLADWPGTRIKAAGEGYSPVAAHGSAGSGAAPQGVNGAHA